MIIKRFLNKLSIGILLTQSLLCLSLVSAEVAINQEEKTELSKKIKAFLDQESKNLSETPHFLLRLFKDGMRISEGVEQFPKLSKLPGEELSGLLFYYQLYNEAQRVPHWHANAVEVGVVLNGKMKITSWEGIGKSHELTVPVEGRLG